MSRPLIAETVAPITSQTCDSCEGTGLVEHPFLSSGYVSSHAECPPDPAVIDCEDCCGTGVVECEPLCPFCDTELSGNHCALCEAVFVEACNTLTLEQQGWIEPRGEAA